jgi:ribosome biogenesis GTPase A
MLMDVKEEDLKTIIPARTIKPQIYQVRGNQSFAAGGLARLDVYGADHATVAWYLSDRLDLHRGKAEAADELWQKHYGELLKPVPLKNQFHTLSIHKHEEKTDVVFDGLGWACVSGNVKTITAKAPESVNITFRKAML